MKILLLNQTFHPDVVASAQHSSDLARHLVERGHEVTVVCGRRGYDSVDERYASREIWRGVRIRRIWSSSFGKKSRWRRAADFGTYLASCCIHLTGLPRYDVVVAMTSPPLMSSAAAFFARIKRSRFIFWVLDLNPDEAVAAGWLRPDSVATRALSAILMYGLRRAALVVALDRYMAERIEKKGIAPARILTVPPWSHDSDVQYDARGRNEFRSAHGLDGKFVVMYSGNHSPCHPLTTLLEAAARLRDRDDVVFCFIGGGSEFETVRRFSTAHALANIVTLPYQPLDMLSASLSSADLHVVVMGDPFVGIVHPCKVYNIRALGLPYLYIGPPESHISELAPTCVARHGQIEAVVDHVLAGQADGVRRTVLVDAQESQMPSQDALIKTMMTAFERVADGPASETAAVPV